MPSPVSRKAGSAARAWAGPTAIAASSCPLTPNPCLDRKPSRPRPRTAPQPPARGSGARRGGPGSRASASPSCCLSSRPVPGPWTPPGSARWNRSSRPSCCASLGWPGPAGAGPSAARPRPACSVSLGMPESRRPSGGCPATWAAAASRTRCPPSGSPPRTWPLHLPQPGHDNPRRGHRDPHRPRRPVDHAHRRVPRVRVLPRRHHRWGRPDHHRHLEGLANASELREIPLTLLFRHLRDDATAMIGGAAATALTCPGNHQEAEYLGRHHTYQMSSFTATAARRPQPRQAPPPRGRVRSLDHHAPGREHRAAAATACPHPGRRPRPHLAAGQPSPLAAPVHALGRRQGSWPAARLQGRVTAPHTLLQAHARFRVHPQQRHIRSWRARPRHPHRHPFPARRQRRPHPPPRKIPVQARKNGQSLRVHRNLPGNDNLSASACVSDSRLHTTILVRTRKLSPT